MATPDVPLLPFDVDADPINIKVWWSWMHSTTHIDVARRSYIYTISHCKDTTGVKHEFLVLEAHICPEHGEVYTICIKVERTVRDRDGPSPRSSSTSINDSVASAADSSDISSSNAKAADLITVLPSDYLLRPSGWEVGRELHLNAGRLSLADIASLISSASTSAEPYKLFKQNCYWFSKTIFDVVLQEFKVDDVVVNPNVALGHYHSISPWIPEPGALNKIVSEWKGKIEIGNNIKSSFEVRMMCFTTKVWRADVIDPEEANRSKCETG